MNAEWLYKILLKTAEVSGWTDLVIIGSQAIHGTLEDPDIAVVAFSRDVDIYPNGGYGANATWENVSFELGQDSDYHVATTNYVEAVPPDLARFPPGWEERSTKKIVGAILRNGESIPITATFPEIHDLVVSKLAVPCIAKKTSTSSTESSDSGWWIGEHSRSDISWHHERLSQSCVRGSLRSRRPSIDLKMMVARVDEVANCAVRARR